MSENSWVVVGRIRTPRGLQGEVLVENLTDFPQRFAPGSTLYVQNPGSDPFSLRGERSHRYRQFWVLKLQGIENRTAAETLRRKELLIPEQSLASLPSNHFYLFHLVGCAVVDASGEHLGEVATVLDAGGEWLLEVRGPCGEILVPMVEGIVKDVDISTRLIRVDLPRGLVGLNS